MKIFASLIGITGKMGKEIQKVKTDPSFQIIGGVAKKDIKNLKKFLKKSNVGIDFSNPNALDELLSIAIKTKTALVLGTTGYSEKDLQKIKDASKKIAIFYSSNFSVGIALVQKFANMTSKLLDKSCIDIVEKHHISKKDKPSGTALLLADEIKQNLKNDVNIHSIRAANVVFEHTLYFTNEDQTIEIKHTAHDRSIFATGAIKAAIFIHDKKAGLYSMQDLIGDIYE
ncbi:MAG: 4-hydroxy-tetrahydrodipicolinate reductase [Candidatus Anoxychlamydiales bacterium]|nr:4-hydroxy-tetrahydrodipicolinate reductase [Candidatus Anoxychlamydiales bacterium]